MPWHYPPLGCLPLPAVLVRVAVVVLFLVFVLVLLRWGYDAGTCLLLASGVGVVAIRVGYGTSRPVRAWPMITITP